MIPRFGLRVYFSDPTIIYKETPASVGEGFVAYTMPKPCWAVLRFLIEPGPRGSGIAYKSIVKNDDILYRYQAQVAQALPDALRQGPLGWEVTDAKITLIAGEHHNEHTHPLDFIVATPMAIMDGLVNTGTTLLEPMQAFRLSLPEETGGKAMGEIIRMRGSVRHAGDPKRNVHLGREGPGRHLDGIPGLGGVGFLGAGKPVGAV